MQSFEYDIPRGPPRTKAVPEPMINPVPTAPPSYVGFGSVYNWKGFEGTNRNHRNLTSLEATV